LVLAVQVVPVALAALVVMVVLELSAVPVVLAAQEIQVEQFMPAGLPGLTTVIS
jgi:hypothetical protein